ncbi:GNAT family N-acetyltransferase [uncultured Pontibacter sp.]|uniref:GNAT family N-acetyltransferase n=1 Tax=uncultured Pontibacter sp. TaxID=453356 RepID=UPI00262EF0FB|nr:GNAT family N-acetyltransferase [uncultured Pontibacter sp.]
MPDFTFCFLQPHDMPLLHQTFLKAFADYLVPIQLSEHQFKAKLQREGIEPTYCVAAYAGSEMVGFILTGLGEWAGTPAAYNAGTGVIPAFRGQKLTQQLYAFLLPKLRESGITLCQLEVIQENEPALKSYRSIGFKITRTLDCFRAKKEELLLGVEAPENISIKITSKPNWDVYQTFWDIAPSWQNTIAAIKRSSYENIILEALDKEQRHCGFLILYPGNGAVAQLAVARSMRCSGIGTALLRQAAQLTKAPALMLINVDRARAGFISYLEQRNFKRVLVQYEMQMPV